MNPQLKATAIAALIVLGAASARADQTNLVQNLSIRLEGITQGKTETTRNVVSTDIDSIRIHTGAVIKQLGTATGNSFSDAAKLVVVTPLPSGNSAIVVRDGNVAVDVSSFFVYEVKSGFVSSSQSNLRTQRSSSTDYSIQRLALVDSPSYPALTLHFDTQGVATESSTSGPNQGTRTELDANVSGWGEDNGKTTILQGTFRINGYSLEVVSSSPPPNV